MNYRAIFVVCLATLGLAVGGQASDKITFVSDRDGHSDVWVMNVDGSDPVNLTQGRDCASPAWSPDGMKIAYIAGGEIWLMNADGSNPQQVTDDSVDKARLFWSEDGNSIYYVAVVTLPLPDEWDGPEAFVTALDGNSSSPVDWREVHSRFQPGVSPDGSQLAAVTLWTERGSIGMAPTVSGQASPALSGRASPTQQSKGATKRAVSMLFSSSAPVPVITCTRVFSCLNH